MTLQTVTLHLPEKLYERIKQSALLKNRTVEDELVGTVEAVWVDDDTAVLPDDLAEEISQLTLLDDEHLWRAARMKVAPEKTERVQALITKQRAEGLTETEEEEIRQLQYFAHRVMLIRAEAAVLLKRRGFDISSLSQPDNEVA